MKIAQLVSNAHSASSTANFAIYSHVAWLCDGLTKAGHEVTLFGAGDSDVKSELFSVFPTALDSEEKMSERQRQLYTRLLISKCFEQASNFDIIHSHFTLLSSFDSRLVNTPTIHSIHSPIDQEIKPFLLEFKRLRYVSFSLAQRELMPELNWYANIYHGVDVDRFAFNDTPEDYLLYLGRVTEEKGVHLAIAAAKAAGLPLVIAGRSYPQEGYWHAKIEKNIDDKKIRYIGEQSLDDKIKWLRGAKALLFPTQYHEVFGYVMIEAMSCGTPVIAWNNGSIPEVVKDGRTGYVVNSLDEMTSAIKRIDKINRLDCRNRAEQFFSVEKMISGYAHVYKRILEEENYRRSRSTQS